MLKLNLLSYLSWRDLFGAGLLVRSTASSSSLSKVSVLISITFFVNNYDYKHERCCKALIENVNVSFNIVNSGLTVNCINS